MRLLEGHTATVTAVAHSPTVVLRALSAGLDGRLIVWDLDEAAALRVVCVGLPILSMAIDAAAPDSAFVLTGAALKAGSAAAAAADVPGYCHGLAAAGRVYAVSLGVSEAQATWAATHGAKAAGKAAKAAGASSSFGSLARPWPAELSKLFTARGATALAVGACGGARAVVGALAGKLVKLHDLASGATVDFNQRREMCCLAISPTEPLAATGDETGRIALLRVDSRSAFDEDQPSVRSRDQHALRTSELHWHAQRVGALAFSADGAYLHSVGKEGVLVLWQLHSGQQSFLPRLGAPLTHLTSNASGTAAAIVGADNAVRLIDLQSQRVRLTLHGLLPATQLVVDRRLRCLVVHGGGAGGRLQWWAPQLDRQLASLEVAPRNISGSLPPPGGDGAKERRALRKTAAEGGTARVYVQLCCFSSDGLTLASVESRSDAELRQNAALKFWALVDGSWVLSARVPQPHNSSVSGLAFHPQLLLVASASADAKFKLWEGIEARTPPTAAAAAATAVAAAATAAAAAKGEKASTAVVTAPTGGGGDGVVRWACRSVGYYRQTAATAVAFSVDGSLLAVAYAPDVVTLWDPLTNEMLHALCQPLASPSDALCYVGFPADGGALLAHSASAVLCWHLLSGSLAWMHAATQVVCAATDPQSDAMLVAVSLKPRTAGATAEATEPEAGDAAAGDAAAGELGYAILEFGASELLGGASGGGEADLAAAADATGASHRHGGSVPRRVWQLGGSSPPRAVAFLPSAAGLPGSPLALAASGEMHALVPLSATTTIPAAGGAEAVSELSALASGGASRLAAVFGTSGMQTSATRAAIDKLTAPAAFGTRAVLPSTLGEGEGDDVGGGLDTKPGWEARAIDRFLEKELSRVPSHLLPPVTTIYRHVAHQALRPAPHLLDGGKGVSNLRRAVRAAAVRNGTLEAHKATMTELTPLLQRRFALASDAKKAVRRIKEIAKGGARRASEGDAPPAHEEEAEEDGEGGGASSGRRNKAQKRAARPATQTAADGDLMEIDAAGEGADATAVVESSGGYAEGGEADFLTPGWSLLDMCGLPGGEGVAVRDFGSAPPLRWMPPTDKEGSAAVGALSPADKAFWEREAYTAEELSRMSEWLLASASNEADAADAEEVEAVENPFAGVTLPGAPDGVDLLEEIESSIVAMKAWKLRVDGSGMGLAPLSQQTEAINMALAEANGGTAPPPLPEDWQDVPSKAEWKSLAKTYAQRRRAGESAEDLAVLAAALRASGYKAVTRVVEDVDRAP